MGRQRSRAALLVTALAIGALSTVLTAAPAAPAAFPGHNGWIAFEMIVDGGRDIWIVAPDGSAQTQLTVDPGDDASPAVSPDGTRIAFVSDREGASEVFVMGIDGQDVVRLTTGGGWSPTWSPDGMRIAFVSTRDGETGIFVMDADGQNAVRITTGPDGTPSWSPDGTKIAFGSDRDGSDSIYVMDADGQNVERLTDGPDYDPSWSPDGTKIAFDSARDDSYEIYVMDADGTDEVRLTNTDITEDDLGPSWSPDGTKIAYWQIGVGYTTGGRLFTMNPDGSGVEQLVFFQDTNRSPSWGPGTSSMTQITGFSPDPPITGLEYTVQGTVTVDPPWGHPQEALPGIVDVSDGVQACWSDARATETDGVYTFSCTLVAGDADGLLEVTARFSPDPGVAIMPSADDDARPVIAMPGPPTGIHATPPGAGRQWTVVSWSPPPGPVPNGYQVRCIPLGWPATTGPVLNPDARWSGSVTSPVAVSGLTRGRSYHCKVRARYGIFYFQELGDRYEGPLSVWSNTITVPVVAPPAPTTVRATTPRAPDPRATTVTWTMPPNDTGAPIRFSTTCRSTTGGVTRSATGNAPVVVGQLSRGNVYVCAVTATNTQGSATSAPSNAFRAPR